MKSFWLCSFIFVHLSLLAQNYAFPIESGRWSNEHQDYIIGSNNYPIFTTSWYDNYCGTSLDTLIGGTSFKQIFLCDAITLDIRNLPQGVYMIEYPAFAQPVHFVKL